MLVVLRVLAVLRCSRAHGFAKGTGVPTSIVNSARLFELPSSPWYKNLEESPSLLDQENTVVDALVEALAAAAAAAAKAALQALAELLR